MPKTVNALVWGVLAGLGGAGIAAVTYPNDGLPAMAGAFVSFGALGLIAGGLRNWIGSRAS